jgi:threonine aldolase
MIDLRSDICSLPTPAMWEAMRLAKLGWATLGEDANVAELERRGAEILGAQASVFVPTCTMANIAALLSLTSRGQSVVLEASGHILANEGDGIRALAGLEPLALAGKAGRLDPAEVGEAIEGVGASLLCLENTHTRAGGTVLDVATTRELAQVAHDRGARVHLDGARLANAAVALEVPLAELTAHVDTVAFSLNKGLCAPFGALLAGEAELVATARGAIRRLGGGTLHRLGIMAAAGLIALETMVDRLADDHRRARDLEGRLRAQGVTLEDEPVETNIVYVPVGGSPEGYVARLAERGVLAFSPDGLRLRLVTHRLIGDAEVERASEVIAEVVLGDG